MPFYRTHQRVISFLFVILSGLIGVQLSYSLEEESSHFENILSRMRNAFEGVRDYRTDVEIWSSGKDGFLMRKKFQYTFKKPNRIRIEMEYPHGGMVLVYPDADNKVFVRPGGWARFFTFALAPDDYFLRESSGQRIDQTDLGLLIRNITRSVKNARDGKLKISKQGAHFRIRVLADNHFREDVSTLYTILIDRTSWLPVEIEESTPEGTLERKIIFRNLKINIDVQDRFFRADEG